jgi:hypothetical protein
MTNDMEFILESIIGSENKGNIAFNCKNNIKMWSSIHVRFISFLFFISDAEKDVYRSLYLLSSMPKIQKENNFELVPVIKKLYDNSQMSTFKKVLLVRFIYDAYCLDIVTDIALYLNEINDDEIRQIYSLFRVITERPQFVILEKCNKNDILIYSYIKNLIEKKVLKKFEFSTLNKNEDTVLFLFGHAQPLGNIGSHWRQVVTYVLGFSKAFPDKKINLLVTNDSSTNELENNFHHFPLKGKDLLLSQLIEINKGKLPSNITVEIINPFLEVNYFNSILAKFDSINPAFIISWLGFFSAEIFFSKLSEKWPIASIQFQKGNVPSEYSQLVFSHGRLQKNDRMVSKYRDHIWMDHPIPLVPEENKGTHENNELFLDNHFYVATTLGGGRFERSFVKYSDAFIDEFVRLFDTYPRLVWIFIGVADEVKIISKHEKLKKLVDKKRIIILSRVDGLRSFYSKCDMYVHLPHLHGGGWGIALAAFENIPVLCQSGVDGDNFLPTSSMFETEKIFFHKFIHLMGDVHSRAEYIENQKLELEKHSPVQVACYIYSSLVDRIKHH